MGDHLKKLLQTNRGVNLTTYVFLLLILSNFSIVIYFQILVLLFTFKF
jgi:hypothetical protein